MATIARSVSRTEGVAPLYVHFVAGFESSDSDASKPFHSLHYKWDFGDLDTATWETTGLSKNVAYGPIAAHVFESAGEYTVELTIVNSAGVEQDTETFTITVTDPDTVYAGTDTVCVSDSAASDFTGAPSGSTKIVTDDLSTVTSYASAGRRILFRRGSSWTLSAGLSWPQNDGPVTIGAFGSGNKPHVVLEAQSFFNLSYKKDWRIMDIEFSDPTKTYDAVSGTSGMQNILIFRIDSTGGDDPIGWTHWHDSTVAIIRNIAVVECDVSGVDSYPYFIGAEYLAFLGNVGYDSDETHICRVWQAYASVISNNKLHGSSLVSGTGRHALKLHGPKESEVGSPPSANSGELAERSYYTVVSDNRFGSSGPWPVGLGPQDSGSDERLLDIIFERNVISEDYGTDTPTDQAVQILVMVRYGSIRNNVLDCTNGTNGYYGIQVRQIGVEPAPIHVDVFNNTIYRGDAGTSNEWYGVRVEAGCTNIAVKNNLFSWPNATVTCFNVDDNSGGGVTEEGNQRIDDPSFVDPLNATPLSRNFDIREGSEAIDAGVSVSLRDDYLNRVRNVGGSYDIGAFEFPGADPLGEGSPMQWLFGGR